jgi:hypothetical protein
VTPLPAPPLLSRPYSTGGDEMVGHHLEEVRVQTLAVVVGPLDSPAHAGRQPLHLDAHALDVRASLIPVISSLLNV